MPEPPKTGFQRLGERFKTYLPQLWPLHLITDFLAAAKSRFAVFDNWLKVEGYPLMYGNHPSWAVKVPFALAYLWLGVDTINIKAPVTPPPTVISDPSQVLAHKLREMMGDPTVVEMKQTLGALITDTVLGSLEKGLETASADPLEAARSFHGEMATISVVSGLLSTVVEAATGGAVKNAGDIVKGMYWNLGLGFLGWQTLAPLLENGLQPPLRQYYSRKYRPERFTASQMADLFALGKASADEVRDTLRDLGWRDQDVGQWLDLAYRNLSEGDIWKLYHDGHMSQSEAGQRLRALGYNPDDIPLVFQANPKETTAEIKDVLLSTAKAAYKNHLLSADDVRRILREQKRAEEEIGLLLALWDLELAGEQDEFNRGEIHTLYGQRVIARPEAITYLARTGLSDAQAGLLLQAWEAADLPAAVKINQSTIREAFTSGVLTREQAKSKLADVGYTGGDAELLVATWETAIALSKPVPGPTGAGALTLTQLAQMAAVGLLAEAALRARPELEKYAAEDRDRLVSLMFQAPTASITELAESVLVAAYRFDILTAAQLRERLAERGLSGADLDLALAVIEREVAVEREAEITGTVRRPSVGALQLALQRELITSEQFTARLLELGFTADAAAIYLFNAQYQAPASPRDLTTAQVLAAYRDGDFIRAEAQYRLVKAGYNVEDAQLLIKGQRLTPGDTEVGEAWLAGLIDDQGAREYFEEHGYSEDQIEAFFSGATAA